MLSVSAEVGVQCFDILALYNVWLCISALCVLQCAKNSVESGRLSNISLNLSRMVFRVTAKSPLGATSYSKFN